LFEPLRGFTAAAEVGAGKTGSWNSKRESIKYLNQNI
jgi:hypothetical protein